LEAAYGAYSELFIALDSASLHAQRDREIALVAQICARQFKWGATDLLRGRSTAVLGYGRLQAESVGLVHLFLQQPAAAQEWFAATSHDLGKAFYRKHQTKLVDLMRDHPGLEQAYKRGSGEALHVRVWVILRGHEIKPSTMPGIERFTVGGNDIRAKDPFPFLETAGWFFGLQAAVVNGLRKGFPEIQGQPMPSLASAAYFAQQFLDALQSKYRERYR
jgi:hypothetical protein